MSSRDARFDGQFITGVHTTGIYCRPSCPAVTPKPGNVTFYLTAAAAHEAGLRACKRCLPDAVPGSPEWNIRDDLAATRDAPHRRRHRRTRGRARASPVASATRPDTSDAC